MGTTSRWLVLGLIAITAGGCQILSYTWTAPANVPAGAVFVMDVTGLTDSTPGLAWAVFEVPTGFEVLGVGAVTQPMGYSVFAPTAVTANPADLAPYVANPAHQLFGVNGQVLVAQSAITATVKVYVRAPVTAGSHTLRMALAVGNAGALQPQLGLSSFQTATGSTARTVQVQAQAPATPFTLANDGLWGQARPIGVACRDIDRDGRDELVLVYANDLEVFRGGPGGFVLASSLAHASTQATRLQIAVADLDGDGWQDFVLADGRTWFGVDGSNWTVGPVLTPTPSYFDADVATGDFDGDGVLDVALATYSDFQVFRGLGNRTFGAGTTLPYPSGNAFWLLAADLDLDGRSELVLANVAGPGTQLWSWVPGTGWTLGASLPAAAAACAIEADGQPGKELLLSGQAARYRWSAQSLTVVPGTQALSFERAAVADFDRDGFDDLVLTHFAPPAPATLEAWRRTSATQFAAVNLPTSAGFRVLGPSEQLTTGDFDGDDWPDLFAAMDVLLAWHNSNTGAAAFGVGCSAAAQPVPQLAAVGAVGTATTFDLHLASGLPAAISIFWAGNSRQTLQGVPVLPLSLTPLGAPGCFLLAEPLGLWLAVADGAGVASASWTVPALPSTWQVAVYSQAAVIDLAANPLGGRFSQGLALKLQ